MRGATEQTLMDNYDDNNERSEEENEKEQNAFTPTIAIEEMKDTSITPLTPKFKIKEAAPLSASNHLKMAKIYGTQRFQNPEIGSIRNNSKMVKLHTLNKNMIHSTDFGKRKRAMKKSQAKVSLNNSFVGSDEN